MDGPSLAPRHEQPELRLAGDLQQRAPCGQFRQVEQQVRRALAAGDLHAVRPEAPALAAGFGEAAAKQEVEIRRVLLPRRDVRGELRERRRRPLRRGLLRGEIVREREAIGLGPALEALALVPSIRRQDAAIRRDAQLRELPRVLLAQVPATRRRLSWRQRRGSQPTQGRAR